MKANRNERMVMSATPTGTILITCTQVNAVMGDLADDEICRISRACSDAATEVLPFTEEAFSDFCSRHPTGRPVHPTLRAYPYPRE